MGLEITTPDDLDSLLSQLDELPTVDQALAVIAPQQTELLGAMPDLPGSGADSPVLDVRKHIKRHELISDEILGSWRADREEAQGAINTIQSLIERILTNGKEPSGTYLEALVGAIKAKADTNATAVRILDATTKLMAASKAPTSVQQTNTTVNYDLTAILSNPVAADDV